MAKKKTGEYEIEFWKDWLEADMIKKQELVEKLPFFKMCLVMEDNKMWRHSFTTLINGYFEDLESAVYTKIRLEQKRKNKRSDMQKNFDEIAKPLQKAAKKAGLTKQDLTKSIKEVRKHAA